MCTNPILMRNKKFRFLHVEHPHAYMKVPCGVCDECLKKRANDLLVRAHYAHECSERNGGTSFMTTLTYSNACLPWFTADDGTRFMVFDKKGVINFIKRLRVRLDRYFLRKYGNKAPDFKYLITSEFGTDEKRTHRPHYHCLFFFDGAISLFAFNLCYRRSLYEELPDGSIRRYFGKIAQVELLDPKRGGIKYSSKYVLKDLLYEPQRKAITDKIKFYTSYVESLHSIISLPQSYEDEFRNSCLRSTKAYKQDIARYVLPFRHMLQFYMCSNDLGTSYIIEKYGQRLLSNPCVNFEGIPYSLPRVVKERLRSHYGDTQYNSMSKCIFLRHLNNVLHYNVEQRYITKTKSLVLKDFVNKYIHVIGGNLYLSNPFGVVYSLEHSRRDFDSLIDEISFYDDNSFYELRSQVLECLSRYDCEDNLKFRAYLAKKKRDEQLERDAQKSRNNSYKYQKYVL